MLIVHNNNMLEALARLQRDTALIQRNQQTAIIESEHLPVIHPLSPLVPPQSPRETPRTEALEVGSLSTKETQVEACDSESAVDKRNMETEEDHQRTTPASPEGSLEEGGTSTRD